MTNETLPALRGRRTDRAGISLALALLVTAGGAFADKPVFVHPFDGAPIQVPLKEGETETPALEQFKETGVNAYRGQAEALADGQRLYEQWCQVCHAANASGNMGPSLVGDKHVYSQTATDVGMFAIVYAGASGAMQGFAGRISQDDMLKIIAYVRSLDK